MFAALPGFGKLAGGAPCTIATMLLQTPRVLFDSWLVTIYDPSTISDNFHSLELVFTIGAVATLCHAVKAQRRGDSSGLLIWLTAVLYGLLMEVVSYNTVDNFTHAQFTVQFYYKQLPFYVVGLYPAFLYPATIAARRLQTTAPPRDRTRRFLTTLFVAGLLAMMLDVPFDIMGPDSGWWVWHEGGEDPYGLVAHRWLGVPVSSYCWHLLFGGSLAALCEYWRPRLNLQLGRRGVCSAIARLLPLALCLGVASIVVGVVAMMPFHIFRAVGLNDGVFTITLLAVAATFVVTLPEKPGTRASSPLWHWAVVWYSYYIALGYFVWPGSEHPDWPLKAFVTAAVAGAALTLHRNAHARRS